MTIIFSLHVLLPISRLENTRLEVRIRDLDSGSRHMGDSLMSEQQWEKITKSEFGVRCNWMVTSCLIG